MTALAPHNRSSSSIFCCFGTTSSIFCTLGIFEQQKIFAASSQNPARHGSLLMFLNCCLYINVCDNKEKIKIYQK